MSKLSSSQTALPTPLWVLFIVVPWSALLALPALVAGGCDSQPQVVEQAKSATKGSAAKPLPPKPAPKPKPAPSLTNVAVREPLSPFATPAPVDPMLPASVGKPDVATQTDVAELEPKPKPKPSYVPAPEAVAIERFLLSRDVQDREPVDEDEVFTTEDAKIYAFLHFANPDAEPYEVTVHFEPAEGPETPYGVTLNVETSKRWRTWAFTRVKRDPGTYRAVVRNTAGEEIASQLFEIVEPGEF